MWSLLARRQQLILIIGAGVVSVLIIDAIAIAMGSKPGIVKWISFAAVIVGTILAGLAEMSWRPIWRWFPAVQRSTFPDLNGIWQGTLISTWVNPETGQVVPPIATTITIRQGLFSMSVSLKTGESESQSTRTFLEAFRDRRHFRIWYSYNNDPQAQFQHRSSPHEGVAFLDLKFDEDRNQLTGRYYTARRTTGDIDVHRTNAPLRPWLGLFKR